MAELARRIPNAIRLDVGDPSFNTAPHICDAAFAAMAAGHTKYTPSGGYSTLRGLIGQKLAERNRITVDPDQVVATAGGCGGLFTSLLSLLDPGDDVLVPDPGWPNYRAMVHVLGGNSVGYRVNLEDGTVSADELESRISDNTKAVIVNSPNNPTGAVYSREALESIAAVCDRHDLWLISDECYDEIVFDGRHTSVAAVAPSDRLISVFSFSKTYAMTGWRIGYVVASHAFASELVKAQEPVHGNASSVSQKAAEAALLGSQDAVALMRDTYRRRRGLAIKLLDQANIRHLTPAGAFYLMIDVSTLGPSMDFARNLLELDHVSVVPGAAFGPHGDPWVRISLCAPDETLNEGINRIINRLTTG